MKHRSKQVIGIDEVGRGPIAGPVAVGAFVFLDTKAAKIFRGVRESKQLSERGRERWFSVILDAKKAGLADFEVSFQSERVIDTKGISHAIREALTRSLQALVDRNRLPRGSTSILLDGGLTAPAHFRDQKTIIHGDAKKKTIALASICAKVLRDRKMNELAKKHPEYGFDKHKGYGTRDHYQAIEENGILDAHRMSFLKTRR